MGHYNPQCRHDLDIGTNHHPLNMHLSNPLPLHCQKTLRIHGQGPPSHHCHTLSDWSSLQPLVLMTHRHWHPNLPALHKLQRLIAGHWKAPSYLEVVWDME